MPVPEQLYDALAAGYDAAWPAPAPEAELVRGRAEALPFADRSFDAAISADAFNEVDQPPALAELLRVVKPGGVNAIWWRTLSADGDLPAETRLLAAYGSRESALPVRVVSFVYLGRT